MTLTGNNSCATTMKMRFQQVKIHVQSNRFKQLSNMDTSTWAQLHAWSSHHLLINVGSRLPVHFTSNSALILQDQLEQARLSQQKTWPKELPPSVSFLTALNRSITNRCRSSSLVSFSKAAGHAWTSSTVSMLKCYQSSLSNCSQFEKLFRQMRKISSSKAPTSNASKNSVVILL